MDAKPGTRKADRLGVLVTLLEADEERHWRVDPPDLIEFLKPMGLSQNRLARELGVPPRRINEIVHGRRRNPADTALRLGTYFSMSPESWLGLQNARRRT